MTTLLYSGTLEVETCWCGIRHAVPMELLAQQRRQFEAGEKQIGIYCPLGHSWIKTGSPRSTVEIDALQRRLASAESTLTHTRDQLDAERRSHAAAKGQITKLRKRAAAGVCPCCQRSFAQLRRHMATKHPDYAHDATDTKAN